MPTQNRWRNCAKCQSLFFNGHAGVPGVCPRDGGGHVATGYDFTLTHTEFPFVRVQRDWYTCWYCQVLYYAGHPDRPGRPGEDGACPARLGRGHTHGVARTFRLMTGLGDGSHMQSNWRNCRNCQALFFAGSDRRGSCPSGGSHEGHLDDPDTLDFCLAYPMNPRITVTRVEPVISVLGDSFTPDGQVHISWKIVGENGTLEKRSDTVHCFREGDFRYTFHAQGRWDFLTVRAWDVTSDTPTLVRSVLSPARLDLESAPTRSVADGAHR
ncbi:hypothetical protein ACWDUC_12440 [Streptomyces tricolor]